MFLLFVYSFIFTYQSQFSLPPLYPLPPLSPLRHLLLRKGKAFPGKSLHHNFVILNFVIFARKQKIKTSAVLFIKCKFNLQLLNPVNNLFQVLSVPTQEKEGKAIFCFYLNVKQVFKRTQLFCFVFLIQGFYV